MISPPLSPLLLPLIPLTYHPLHLPLPPFPAPFYLFSSFSSIPLYALPPFFIFPCPSSRSFLSNMFSRHLIPFYSLHFLHSFIFLFPSLRPVPSDTCSLLFLFPLTHYTSYSYLTFSFPSFRPLLFHVFFPRYLSFPFSPPRLFYPLLNTTLSPLLLSSSPLPFPTTSPPSLKPRPSPPSRMPSADSQRLFTTRGHVRG